MSEPSDGSGLPGALPAVLRDFPAAALALAVDGTIVQSNGRLETLLGREVIGCAFAELLDPLAHPKWERLLAGRDRAASGTVWEFTLVQHATLVLRTFAAIWGTEQGAANVLWLVEYARDVQLEPLYQELAVGNAELLQTQRELVKERSRLARSHAELARERAFLEALFGSVPNPIAVIGPDEVLTRWNPALVTLFGYSPEELAGCRLVELIVPESRRVEARRVAADVARGAQVEFETELIRKDGQLVTVRVGLAPVPGTDGTRVELYTDVTALRRTEATLRAAQNDLALVLEASTAILYRVAIEGDRFRSMWVSDNVTRLMGYSVAEAVGATWWMDHVHPADRAGALDATQRLVVDDRLATEYRFQHADGHYRWIFDEARVTRDAEGRPFEVLGTWADVSDRKELEARLAAQALTDGLTGLANRRAFDAALEREWQRTRRDGAPLSLLLLDVDHFKSFNDQYGHQVGDDCLRAVAMAVAGAVSQPGAVVARYGGEELAVVLADTDAPAALIVAECVRAAIEGLRVTHAGNPEGGGWVTASVGVATALPRAGGTITIPQALLSAADGALYRAKHQGRNRAVATVLLTGEATPAVVA